MAVEFDGGVVIGADSRTTRGYALIITFTQTTFFFRKEKNVT